MLLLLHGVECCVEFIYRRKDACHFCAVVGSFDVDVVVLVTGNCSDTLGCTSSRC